MSGLGSVGDLRTAIAEAVSNARHRWGSYVADCDPVGELDEHGRTLDQAIADRVVALVGQAWERSQAIEALFAKLAEQHNAAKGLNAAWLTVFYEIDRLRGVGSDRGDEP